MDKIDFVVPWVDGSDIEWQKEKQKYQYDASCDGSVARYRDWGLLRYWFRGIEKFAPWVNKVHFITCGHLPKWLNTKYDKLNIVLHKDYIPNEYLPTFSANPIELNVHRIKGLSEKFVYFNDDCFILSPVKKNDFFDGDLPKDTAVLSAHCYKHSNVNSHYGISDVGLINDVFNFHDVIKRDVWKWMSPKYGLRLLLQTSCLIFAPRFPGFWQHHLPQSYCKSTFEEVWNTFPDVLDETCRHKFRNRFDVNHWLMREWKICKGEFSPRSYRYGKSLVIEQDKEKELNVIANYVKGQRGKCISINDSDMNDEFFMYASNVLKNSFEEILSNKSKFEI